MWHSHTAFWERVETAAIFSLPPHPQPAAAKKRPFNMHLGGGRGANILCYQLFFKTFSFFLANTPLPVFPKKCAQSALCFFLLYIIHKRKKKIREKRAVQIKKMICTKCALLPNILHFHKGICTYLTAPECRLIWKVQMSADCKCKLILS